MTTDNFSVKCEIGPNDPICISDTFFFFKQKKHTLYERDKAHDLSSRKFFYI